MKTHGSLWHFHSVCATMGSGNSMSPPPGTIDEYISTFPPGVQVILETGCRTRCPRDHQLQDAGVPAERGITLLRRFQKAYRTVSACAGRREIRDRNCALRRKKGKPSISARSAHSVWTDRENREAQSKAEFSEARRRATNHAIAARPLTGSAEPPGSGVLSTLM